MQGFYLLPFCYLARATVRELLSYSDNDPLQILDRDGAKQVLTALIARFPGLQLIWADGGYAGKLVTWVATVL